jgi:hypothetical protein
MVGKDNLHAPIGARRWNHRKARKDAALLPDTPAITKQKAEYLRNETDAQGRLCALGSLIPGRIGCMITSEAR